jgi:hypothetical protein
MTFVGPCPLTSRSNNCFFRDRSMIFGICVHLHQKLTWPMARWAKNVIWPWGQRSRSHEGHYGTWHTVLWSCAHIPNIIDLSRKKQLFDLEVKGQGPTKVITVRDTPPWVRWPRPPSKMAAMSRHSFNRTLLQYGIWIVFGMQTFLRGLIYMLKLCLLTAAILNRDQDHWTQFWKLTT